MLLRALMFRLAVHVLHPRSTPEAFDGLLRTASLWQPSPWVPWLIVAIGGVTALHGTVVARLQSDI